MCNFKAHNLWETKNEVFKRLTELLNHRGEGTTMPAIYYVIHLISFQVT